MAVRRWPHSNAEGRSYVGRRIGKLLGEFGHADVLKGVLTRFKMNYAVGDSLSWPSGPPSRPPAESVSNAPACTLSPVPVTGGLLFERLSIGASHACTLTVRGEAYCWGARERSGTRRTRIGRCRWGG